MVVIMKQEAGESEISEVANSIMGGGLKADVISGEERSIIAVIGVAEYDENFVSHLSSLPGVEKVNRISKPYKLASKACGNGNKVVAKRTINGNEIAVEFGGREVVIIGGPCSVEDKKMIENIAAYLSGNKVNVIRAGAFKPRTAPRSFEGLGEDGLKILSDAREKYGTLITSEMLDVRHAEVFLKYVDIVQIGTRNMQNFELLKVAGDMNLPVILKRGMSATIDEWLCSAEYILDHQKDKAVILCERGIRTFETSTRNTLDINAVPVAKALSWLPIIVDPSHATGKRQYVSAVSCAAVAAGADGLIIEVHHNPSKAWTDGDQSIDFGDFGILYNKVKKVAKAVDRFV